MNELGPLENSVLPVRFTSSELIERAHLKSRSAPLQLRHSVYLYYIARFATSYYEVNASDIGEIPIQVWNEYRNALDHFMRHVTLNPNFDYTEELSSTPEGNHLSKMDGHIQRAALDALKLIVHLELDECRQEIKKFRQSTLRLGDEGHFFDNYNRYKLSAQKAFQEAKVLDSELGEHPGENKDVLTRYIDAAAAVSMLKVYFDKHSSHLEKIEYGFLNNFRRGKILSNLNATSITVVWGLIFFILGSFVNADSIFDSISKALNSSSTVQPSIPEPKAKPILD